MSKLHIKQVAGPVAGAKSPTGAIPVFDGNLVRWSNAATTGLQIPTGSTLQRPGGTDVTDGLLRYNTDLNKVEIRENGAWSNVVSGIKSFLDLADAPKTYAGSVGKVLAVKADGTGLEYIDPTVTIDKITGTNVAQAGKYVAVKPDGSGLQYVPLPPFGNFLGFRFKFTLADQFLAANGISELPPGWSVVISGSNNSILTFTHTVGVPPASGTSYGWNSNAAALYYQSRPVGTQSFELRWKPDTATTTFVLSGLNYTTTGATQGSFGYVYLWFAL